MNNLAEVNRGLDPIEVDEIVWELSNKLQRARFDDRTAAALGGRLGDIAAGDRAREAAVDYSFWNGRTGGDTGEPKRQALVDKAKALAARDNPLDPRDDADGAFKAELRSPRERFDDEEWPTSGEAMRAIGILSKNPRVPGRNRRKLRFITFNLTPEELSGINAGPTDMMILSNLP